MLKGFVAFVNPYLMARASDDRGEYGPGGIISGESGLAHAGAVVDHKSRDLVVTHLAWFGVGLW